MSTPVPWPLTLFVLIMLPVVISLGFWQLGRAAEKEALELSYIEREGGSPLPLGDGVAFQPVRETGAFLEQQFLVDNQVLDGQVGYWLLQAFENSEKRRFLVNRGWVAAPERRQQLPSLETPSGMVTITGLIWPELGLPPLLEEETWTEEWPLRVQRRNVQRMAAMIGAEPIELRLYDGQPGVQRAAPVVPSFGRETHLGYAFQWFGLGGVLIIGWLVVHFRGGKR